jgi:hypothetical protein
MYVLQCRHKGKQYIANGVLFETLNNCIISYHLHLTSMPYGRAHKDHLQIEKKIIFLPALRGLRRLNYSFYLVIKSAHLRKIKAQIENII